MPEQTKDDCVGGWIKELEQKHPDWDKKKVEAVALKKCGESNQGKALDTADKAGAALSNANASVMAQAGKLIHGLLKKHGMGHMMDEAPSEDAAYEESTESADEVASETPADEDKEKSLFQRSKDHLASFLAGGKGGNFIVFKSSDGRAYWLARHTNQFEDRQREILRQSSHERYIARVHLGLVDKPELRSWHVKGTAHGKADQLWEQSGFVFALGHFDDTPEGRHAADFYRSYKGKVELSHGFYYPDWAFKDGVYETYNTFEISTLPAGAAANPFTSFKEINTMAMSEAQRQWIQSTLGDEALARVDKAQAEAAKDSEVLKAIDVKYKDFADPKPEKEATKAEGSKDTAALLVDLIEAQSAPFATLRTLEKALDARTQESNAKIAALETQVKDITAQWEAHKLNSDMKPRRPSVDELTKLNPDMFPKGSKARMLMDELQQEAQKADESHDEFWGRNLKPAQNGTGG